MPTALKLPAQHLSSSRKHFQTSIYSYMSVFNASTRSWCWLWPSGAIIRDV
jgi:hypothetical protein